MLVWLTTLPPFGLPLCEVGYCYSAQVSHLQTVAARPHVGNEGTTAAAWVNGHPNGQHTHLQPRLQA